MVLADSSTPATLPVSALCAVLLAAVLHAVWNAIAHAIEDRAVAFALMGATYAVGAVPVVLASAPPRATAWPFIVGSAAVHVLYNLLLMRCYRLGDFGQVYPLARGTSPLLVAVAALLFAGERLRPAGLVGVLAVSAGLASLIFAGGRPTRAQLPGIGAALLTGLTIAVYTSLDGFGVRRTGAASYAGWLFLLQGLVIPWTSLGRRRAELWPALRRYLLPAATSGVLGLIAYGLVLWAQTRGALAPVAALRETSVIFGAVIATVVFGERFGRWRVTAAVLVAAGVVLINL